MFTINYVYLTACKLNGAALGVKCQYGRGQRTAPGSAAQVQSCHWDSESRSLKGGNDTNKGKG